MKLKTFSLVTLITGAAGLVIGFGAPVLAFLLSFSEGHTISIIGGADAPTLSFLFARSMKPWHICLISLSLALIVTALFCLIFRKTTADHCRIKTTLLSLTISATGALGLLCLIVWFPIAAFNEASRYPIEYSVSQLVGVLCLVVATALLVAYGKTRYTYRSLRGVVIDVLTCLLYFPFFFNVSSFFYSLVS